MWQLLGGQSRNKLRVYGHVYAETLDEVLSECRRLRADGFTAVGHINPFLDEASEQDVFGPTHPASTVDADHDAVKALIRWVEQGVALDRIVATKYVNNASAHGIERQRPLCAYPTVARYDGRGDLTAPAASPAARRTRPTWHPARRR